MVKVESGERALQGAAPADLTAGKRRPTKAEIDILVRNGNVSSDPEWRNVYVSGEFNPEYVRQSEFSGFVVLGAIRAESLSYHDLELKCGIYNSSLRNVVIGDSAVVKNVRYLSNYRIGSRVILFNIDEMSCTLHSKFGEGLIKEGESEDVRIWIETANENGRRAVLPFRDMIPADAYLWSRYREDGQLMRRFVELTEHGKSRARNTYGTVGDDAVIKNSFIIKDADIGRASYIKGAFKLKNMTVLSSEDEPSQIGEGVEMVNGIMGHGSKVFYQAVAVRFVIGRNCQLKYGARLLNSILGDNSTVSCCEILNNLIFPFHEQHHNSSFLIASTIMGQSNIAAASTIGSNHNSRSPDCELLAGRGFWAGLCSDFKFDSRFASFVLAAKGSYANELNITYPFSLLEPAQGEDGAVHITPAYWFLHNMFAVIRNKYKFAARDRRKVKVQHIETNPFAPDSMQEVIAALERLIELTLEYLELPRDASNAATESAGRAGLLEDFRARVRAAGDRTARLQLAKDYLHQNPAAKFTAEDARCQRRRGAVVHKIPQAYREYRRALKFFAAESLIAWARERGRERLSREAFAEIQKIPLYTSWLNAGGQVMPEEKVSELFEKIKSGEIASWGGVHAFYDECEALYAGFKARYAVCVMEYLYSKGIAGFTHEDFKDFLSDVEAVSQNILESSVASREKDYTDSFRSITFRNKAERDAVLGELSGNSFLNTLRRTTEEFSASLETLFGEL